ncbi:uncharacterized protein LOC111274213 [Durio zibethinus]|uniref:beta-ketoacyl-[acyl-carrier-protein] synthase I n=1 Tax=Durio zibethinus TaxID=66656 RepID=A0A6P5WEU8_DURZI|nr:uncharacterized protein LOC111274213 [Durio zibethinus]
MESLENAMKRGAPIIAEYLGGAINCDSYHITDPRADGIGVSSCIGRCLGVSPEEVILSSFSPNSLVIRWSNVIIVAIESSQILNISHFPFYVGFFLFTSIDSSASICFLKNKFNSSCYFCFMENLDDLGFNLSEIIENRPDDYFSSHCLD